MCVTNEQTEWTFVFVFCSKYAKYLNTATLPMYKPQEMPCLTIVKSMQDFNFNSMVSCCNFFLNFIYFSLHKLVLVDIRTLRLTGIVE